MNPTWLPRITQIGTDGGAAYPGLIREIRGQRKWETLVARFSFGSIRVHSRFKWIGSAGQPTLLFYWYVSLQPLSSTSKYRIQHAYSFAPRCRQCVH
mgnify:CR=1 FL=1